MPALLAATGFWLFLAISMDFWAEESFINHIRFQNVGAIQLTWNMLTGILLKE
jgi:hypothetical protein